MENTKAYKIEITTEKSQGKIKTKSIYFLNEEDAKTSCSFLIDCFKQEGSNKTLELKKAILTDNDKIRLVKANRYFETYMEFLIAFDKQCEPMKTYQEDISISRSNF